MAAASLSNAPSPGANTRGGAAGAAIDRSGGMCAALAPALLDRRLPGPRTTAAPPG